MEYITLTVREYLAHSVFEKLGSLGVVQFTDLNGDLTAFKRLYTPMIRSCDELEKKLRFFEEEMARFAIEPVAVTPAEFAAWRTQQGEAVARSHGALPLLDYWSAIIEERHRDYVSVKAERDRMAAGLAAAAARRCVIEHASEFFEITDAGGSGGGAAGEGVTGGGSGAGLGLRAASAGAGALESGKAPAAADADVDSLSFRHMAGLLPYEDKSRFARIVFRASSGHAAVRFSDVPGELISAAGESRRKSVFAIFYRGSALTPKLERICAAFGAATEDVPNFGRPADVEAALADVTATINEGIAWIRAERRASGTALAHLGLLVAKWRIGIAREKAIFHTLNCCTREPERGTVSAAGWVLKTAISDLTEALRAVHAVAAAGGRAQPYFLEVVPRAAEPDAVAAGRVPSTPPTFFKTNKLTVVFQGIVDTYGAPRYGEANPALFSIMTFPFLFGVMYGDVGHAVLLTLASAWMVWKEASLCKTAANNEIFGE
jgi:V-type H+-transporting ATPase subunit a